MCKISIHALLAESDSDNIKSHYKSPPFLSTLSLRRATPPNNLMIHHAKISIHALLAESDRVRAHSAGFNIISIHALLAESDLFINIESLGSKVFLSTLSLRRATQQRHIQKRPKKFLSTLSLRRATVILFRVKRTSEISIHALLAESDSVPVKNQSQGLQISIHALLAESDLAHRE